MLIILMATVDRNSSPWLGLLLARMVVPKFVRVVSFYSYLASCVDGGVA
jgi:hypothetical protein